jgi:OOP family OmpA-OmpF porin
VLTGHVAGGERTRQNLLAAAKAVAPAANTVDRMEFAEGAPSGWGEVALALLRELARLDSGSAELKDATLTVGGVAHDDAQAQAIRSALRAAVPQTFTLVDQIRVREVKAPEPPPAPAPTAPAPPITAQTEPAPSASTITPAEPVAPAPSAQNPSKPAEETDASASKLPGREQPAVEEQAPAAQQAAPAVKEQAPPAQQAAPATQSKPETTHSAEAPTASSPSQPSVPEPKRAIGPEPPSQSAPPSEKQAANATGQVAEPVPVPSKEPPQPQIAMPQPPPTQPLSPQAASCQQELNNIASAGHILFATDSAKLDTGSFDTLDRIAAAAKACPGVRIAIEGHTDAEGSAEYNKRLSVRRAQAVVGYLIKAGADRKQFVAVGYGPAKPAAPNDTEENMAKNRRIEFTIKQ